jgi:hypothetical protein
MLFTNYALLKRFGSYRCPWGRWHQKPQWRVGWNDHLKIYISILTDSFHSNHSLKLQFAQNCFANNDSSDEIVRWTETVLIGSNRPLELIEQDRWNMLCSLPSSQLQPLVNTSAKYVFSNVSEDKVHLRAGKIV